MFEKWISLTVHTVRLMFYNLISLLDLFYC